MLHMGENNVPRLTSFDIQGGRGAPLVNSSNVDSIKPHYYTQKRKHLQNGGSIDTFKYKQPVTKETLKADAPIIKDFSDRLAVNYLHKGVGVSYPNMAHMDTVERWAKETESMTNATIAKLRDNPLLLEHYTHRVNKTGPYTPHIPGMTTEEASHLARKGVANYLTRYTENPVPANHISEVQRLFKYHPNAFGRSLHTARNNPAKAEEYINLFKHLRV